MEFRQILTVILFMVTAALMKNSLSDQLVVTEVTAVESEVTQSSANEMLAIAPSELLPLKLGSASLQQEAVSYTSGEPVDAVPGSLVALVVAALSLVSVARRSSG